MYYNIKVRFEPLIKCIQYEIYAEYSLLCIFQSFCDWSGLQILILGSMHRFLSATPGEREWNKNYQKHVIFQFVRCILFQNSFIDAMIL